MFLPLCPTGKSLQYQLDRRLGKPQGKIWRLQRREKPLVLAKCQGLNVN
jgi:hypothetical protein